MSCYYLSSKLNNFVKEFKFFNTLSRNKLILLSILLMVSLDFFYSQYLYIALKFLFIVFFLSFGRDDFLRLLQENNYSKVQRNLYCFSMYFILIVGLLFIFTAPN